MASYRIHCLDSDGKITRDEVFIADDDGEALELVRLRLEKVDCELWRKVALLPKHGATPRLFA